MNQPMRTNVFKKILMAVVPGALCGCVWATGEMERNFVNPPDSARPGVYWYFINGNLNGGALNTLSNVNLASLSGQFSAMRTGVSLSGMATMAPMQFGVFLVSGTSGGNITAMLTNTGFSIPTGAKLRLLAEGYPTNDLFTLNTFVISGNGDFNVSATSGALNIPGYFSTTGGTFALLRSAGVVSLDINSPTLRLFPLKPYETPITAPFSHVFMDSTGRFYADTRHRDINLPAGCVARPERALQN